LSAELRARIRGDHSSEVRSQKTDVLGERPVDQFLDDDGIDHGKGL